MLGLSIKMSGSFDGNQLDEVSLIHIFMRRIHYYSGGFYETRQ